jgi:predicted RND superfamily exporter protein
MNWGKGIAIMYLAFVAFMLGLVYLCLQQKDIFLVTKDYYKEELAYQDKIDHMQNVNGLSAPVAVNYTEKGLRIDFPPESLNAIGELRLYRPSDATMDISIQFKLVSETSVSLPTDTYQTGLWVLKVSWEKDSEKYYLEEKITL